HVAAPPAATTEDVTKNVAEDVAEAVGTTAPAHATLAAHPGMTELVIGGAFLGIGQHFVGLVGLLEARLCIGVTRIAVRMVLHGHAPVGLLQLLLGRVPLDTQDFVVIPLFHTRLTAQSRRRLAARPAFHLLAGCHGFAAPGVGSYLSSFT